MDKIDKKSPETIDVVAEVESLSAEIKDMAVDLAIYLARAQHSATELKSLEPDFIRLINGSVKVVAQLGQIVKSARQKDKIVYELPEPGRSRDQVETRLKSILDQCSRLSAFLERTKKILD